MDDRMEPLRTPVELDRALSEARRLLEGLDAAGPEGERRFEALLSRIASYRDARSPEAPDPQMATLSDFDRHLRAFGRRWPGDAGEGQAEPWSPMLGGAVRPPQSGSD